MKYKPNWNIGNESFKEHHYQEIDQRNGRLSRLEDKVEELDLNMILRSLKIKYKENI